MDWVQWVPEGSEVGKVERQNGGQLRGNGYNGLSRKVWWMNWWAGGDLLVDEVKIGRVHVN